MRLRRENERNRIRELRASNSITNDSRQPAFVIFTVFAAYRIFVKFIYNTYLAETNSIIRERKAF